MATQVFPEVTRLSTAGNGTHRITLTLNPEHLGEVKVSMVVRDGAVRVSFSAGDGKVQQALSGGTPELHRLLEQAGATETRIVVQQAPVPSTGQQSPGQPQSQNPQQSFADLTGSSAGSGDSRGAAQQRQDTAPDHRQPARQQHDQNAPAPRRTPEPGRIGRLDRTV